MRVVIIGQKWLAAELLALCTALGVVVVQVVTPDLGEARQDALERAAAQLGISVHRVSGHIDHCRIQPCDLLLVANAHTFISSEVRSKALLGALAYHPSLLPRHRGRDAVRWAIHMRESVTGGTLYWLDDGVDTGPVVAQQWCHIRPGDTPAALWRRELGPLGLRLFDDVLRRLLNGDACKGHPQDQELATWEPSWNRSKLGAKSSAKFDTPSA
jgi:methionyl-tRNA formyltransferase